MSQEAEVRERILELLKTKGALSMDEIADELGINTIQVLEGRIALRQQGLIESTFTYPEGDTVKILYSLTEKAAK